MFNYQVLEFIKGFEKLLLIMLIDAMGSIVMAIF